MSHVNRLLRAASLVVTDRRWAAPLSAMALGFGLFIGVAIGPGASGTLATGGVPQVIEIPDFSGGTDESGEGEGGDDFGAALAGPATGGGGGAAAAALPSAVVPLPAYVEPEPLPSAAVPTPAPEPAPTGPLPEQEPKAQEMRGTVVHLNPAAGSYALALSGGELVAVHAWRLPKLGAKLTTPIRRLANGTLAEDDSPERTGTAAKATFNGTVTYLNPDPFAPAYTVSWLGASILIQAPPDPTGAPPALPSLGSYVTVEVAIKSRVPLRQIRVEADKVPPSTYLELSGVYGGLAPDTGKLLLSADSTRESGADLSLAVPPPIDTSRLKIGDSYLATATVEPDGSLTLAGLASDERTRGADDAGSAQGDLRR
jgi:hypothetical protein